jgi:hypothetical protein
MAGRPPKPTKLLELTGAFKRNPKRLAERAGEPVPIGPLGPTPRHWRVKRENPVAELKPAQMAEIVHLDALRKMWKEVSRMAPWLTSGDRIAVELLCGLLLKARLGGIKPSEINVLRGLCNACGLDPSGRAKIDTSAPGVKGAKAVDPRDAFAARQER